MLKERDDLLERSTEDRSQKEEEIVKLNEQMMKLEDRVSTLLASKEHAETELMKVEKSMLEERDELLSHSKYHQAKMEEHSVTLRAEKAHAEKHARDVEKREESFLKEKYDLLERSTEERAQKEEEIVKLNEQMTKLEERVASLMASKEHAETEFKRVEKSMLEERDELLAHLTENKAQRKS